MDKKQMLAARKAALDAKRPPKIELVAKNSVTLRESGLLIGGADLDTLPLSYELTTDEYFQIESKASDIRKWCVEQGLLIAVDGVNRKNIFLAEAASNWHNKRINAAGYEQEVLYARNLSPKSGWFIRFRQEGADMALKLRWF